MVIKNKYLNIIFVQLSQVALCFQLVGIMLFLCFQYCRVYVWFSKRRSFVMFIYIFIFQYLRKIVIGQRRQLEGDYERKRFFRAFFLRRVWVDLLGMFDVRLLCFQFVLVVRGFSRYQILLFWLQLRLEIVRGRQFWGRDGWFFSWEIVSSGRRKFLFYQ